MALQDLIARLEGDTQAEVDAIERQTEAEVRAIDEETARALTAELGARRQTERAERQRALAADETRRRRQAHAEELAARRALVARILERARTLLAEVERSPRYASVLPAHLDEALAFVEGMPVRVCCNSTAASVLAPLVGSRETCSLTTNEQLGPGVIVEAVDGSVRIDNTLTARLARMEDAIRIELVAAIRNPAASSVAEVPT
jgi:vacuolar-type H+-ATPase subunit E/Vma4